MQKELAVIGVGALVSLSGCAINRATGTVSPDADLGTVKSYYVVQNPLDKHDVDRLLRENLMKRGFRAYTGPERPQGEYKADAILTYQDRWMWDITSYMLELSVTLRNAQSDFPLASANSFHTSLTRKSPEEMVDEVLSNIFDKAGAGK